jgi:S1-C subfamily serine protease
MSEQIAANPLLALSRQLEQLVEGVADTIVSVRSHGRSVASGFAWRPGIIVTASDALEADDEISIIAAGGKPIRAEFAGRDPTTDIAVLRLAEDLPAPAPVLASQEVGIGQMVLALGRGKEGVIATLGCVSVAGGTWQSQRGGRIDRLIRLDLRLDRQAEGGIVVNAEGGILGMAVFGPRRKPLIIPMPTIEHIAPKLLADGRIRRGYLGVGLHPVRLDETFATAHALPGRRATMIVSVDPSGPAGKAGVLLGDIIVSLDGEPVAGLRSLFALLSPESVDKAVELKILRAGQMTSTSVTIGVSPAP